MSAKKYLSLLLLFVFLSPVVIQAAHILFVHHHHAVNRQKADRIQNFDKCSICSYEFVEFINNAKSAKYAHSVFCIFIYSDNKHDECIDTSVNLFSLRAPPLKLFLA